MQTHYAHSGAVTQGLSYCDLPLTGCQGGAHYALPYASRRVLTKRVPRACIIDGVGISDIIGIEAVHTAAPDAVIVTHT